MMMRKILLMTGIPFLSAVDKLGICLSVLNLCADKLLNDYLYRATDPIYI